MTKIRTIALTLGSVTTLTAFVGGMALLVLGDIFLASERIFFVSIAIGPVAMFAVIMGYGVWWLVIFLLTLVSPSQGPGNDP